MFNIKIRNSLLAKKDLSIVPDNWAHRLLYVGNSSSTYWLRFSVADNIEIQKELSIDIAEITKSLRKIDYLNFISLGPGDAVKDRYIFKEVNNNRLNYVPVDLNKVFVKNAYTQLQTIVKVPFGIVADFEDDFEFIANEVYRSLNGVTVFGLLGNTIGALDKFENSFLETIDKFCKKDDYLLIEVGLLKTDWTFFHDQSSKSLFHDKPFRAFLANAVSKKSNDAFENVFENFDKRVGIKPGQNDINGATSYEFYDLQQNSKLFCLTRYDWKSLLEWADSFSKNLKIVYKNDYYYNTLNLGTGIIIWKKIN